MLDRSFLFQHMKFVAIGFAMGVANVIPGVSGGTVALISGIYEKLIASIKKIASAQTFKKLLSFRMKELYEDIPIAFLSAIAIGTVLAFATFAKFATWLLENYESYTLAAFLGMILGSILLVVKMVKKWNFLSFIAIFSGAIIAYLIVTMIPYETPNNWWVSFLCGVVVIIAMILPGISGSFLLLILGQYKYVWGAISEIFRFKFSVDGISTCFWMGLGGLIGLGAFSHILNWLFKKYHDFTVCILTGFMLGSLWRLWPWQKTTVYSAKLGVEIKKINIPPDSLETIENLKAQGAKIKPLVQKNFLPEQFDASFFLIVAILVVGFLTVILIEMSSNKDDSNGSNI